MWRSSEAAEELKLKDRSSGSYLEWEGMGKDVSKETKTLFIEVFKEVLKNFDPK